MSVNTAHANNGVLIHAGELILLFSDNVHMDFSGQDNPLFKGHKNGRIYLTTHRMIFNSKNQSDPLQSFSFPFIAMSDVELEQPVFGANYIKGKIRAQPNGNFVGEVKFKLSFKSGGAIEFGQAMLRAASMAQRNMHNGGGADNPPPYTPSGAWHEAPPPAYQPPPGYYGWLPQNDAFTGPPPNSVFMSDNPPPYPGIGPTQPNVAPGGYAQPPQQGYYPPPGNPGFHSGYPGAPPPSYPGQQPQAYPGGGQYFGWGQPPQNPGAPPQGAYGQGYPGGVGFAAQPGGYPAPPQSGGYASNPNPAAGGAMGFSGPPPNSKEAEAAASAYNNNPNQPPQGGFAPNAPPAYYEPPPSYNSLGDRRNQ